MQGMISSRTTWLVSALLVVSVSAFGGSIRVGDIEISPEDFSAARDPEERVAKCLACHGERAGGDIDFGPDVHFGTPALRGMREDYLRDALTAYRDGTRQHGEMSAVAGLLDDETIEFMAGVFSAYAPPPMRPASDLTALAAGHPLFSKGRAIAQKGVSQRGVPPCLACHGPLGEGSAAGPRLAGQNAIYVRSQFEAFRNGSRRTAMSAVMQPVAAGLTPEDIEAIAHYYERVQQPDLKGDGAH